MSPCMFYIKTCNKYSILQTFSTGVRKTEYPPKLTQFASNMYFDPLYQNAVLRELSSKFEN